MQLSFIKELSSHTFTNGEKSKKYYFLANEDGVDVFDIKDNTLLFSFINFQGIMEMFVSYDERFLICLNSKGEFFCYDLIKKEHISTLVDFVRNYGHILSITTSINKNELIILYSDYRDNATSKIIRFSIPLFNLISITSFKNKFEVIRKSNVFNHYYLIDKKKISYYDLNFLYIGDISIDTNIATIKNCLSLESPKRLFIQDFKKVYLLNSNYELYDEIPLINNTNFITKYPKPEDVLDMDDDEDLGLIFGSEMCYTSGIYKDKYLVAYSNNIMFNDPRFKLFDFSTTEQLINLRVLSTLSTVLLLPNYIVISGSNGTYLFNEEEKSELVISNPNNSSLGILHKERIINESIRSTT